MYKLYFGCLIIYSSDMVILIVFTNIISLSCSFIN